MTGVAPPEEVILLAVPDTDVTPPVGRSSIVANTFPASGPLAPLRASTISPDRLAAAAK